MLVDERVVAFQEAVRTYNAAVQGMERYLMNLEPGRAQGLRNWLRTVSTGARDEGDDRPALQGAPLSEQIDAHIDIVLAARKALRKSWRLLRPADRQGLTPPGAAL